jgi:DNA topoisomerase-1
MRLPSSWQTLEHERIAEGRRRARLSATIHRHIEDLVESAASAKAARLRYVNTACVPGIRRLGSKQHWRYVGPDGRAITNREELQRIASLVIPPAWTDVWICPHASGHLQATGRDARGRKQYRYHTRWRIVRDEVKYGRLVAFAEALPHIRRRTDEDLARHGLPRQKVLATVVRLLETSLIRVGNEEYARDNGSVGLTTMRDAHASIDGATIRFTFRGKSGVRHAIDLKDRRLARIVKACRDLPGYELFQYTDTDGSRHAIDSSDVNAYIHEVCGQEFTAKDFRTWAGTVLAARALAAADRAASQAAAQRQVVAAIESVARRLGNTRAVCRKSYIHPAVVDAYLQGTTIGSPRCRSRKDPHALDAEEQAVVRLIAQGLRKSA